MSRMINISDLANLLGVSIATLRRWDKMDRSVIKTEDKIHGFPQSFFLSNSKRWDLDQIEKWINKKSRASRKPRKKLATSRESLTI